MKVDWSFPKQVLVAVVVIAGAGAYPVSVYGTREILTASVVGGVLATMNVLLGYAAIEYSFGKSATVFLKFVLGGMGVRLLALAILLVALIKMFHVHAGALVISMGIFYVVFLALELLFIQKKFNIRHQP